MRTGDESSMSAQRRLTSDLIHRALRDRICLLVAPPGAPLREQSLAEEFGVSRTPIREALTMLRAEGLVTRHLEGGTSVATIDFRQMRDVFALRTRLALLVGDFTCLEMTDSTVERLEQLRTDAAALIDGEEPVRLGALYIAFHEAMLATISNAPLREVSDRLFRQTTRLWMQLLPEMNWDEEVAIVIEEIDHSIEALIESDAARLGEVRSKHMTMLLDRFNAYLRRPLL